MKNPMLFVGIIAEVVVFGAGLMLMGKKTPETVMAPAPVKTSTAPSTKPSVVPSKPPLTVAPTSAYSADVKAKVRAEFINSCHTKAEYSVKACTCTADYQAKNYSESQLAQFYLQYHTTGKISGAIQTIADNCNK